ncbi:MAG: hypothetical protein M1836_006836 [Candelina mexicana]|nr:MAG: hypothetical protein M1836_006836 [Candelina mexicana]
MTRSLGLEQFESFEETIRGLSGSDADCLVIGLDFGTTYSGVAYGFTTKPEEIFTITDWPGARGRKVPKVPTIIKYNDDGSFTWGYELDQSTEGRIEGIKLLLDPDQPQPLYVPASNTKVELKRLGRSPVDVASDLIGAIYEYALANIEAKYPHGYLELLDKKFVLSVPALWSDKAQHATLKAAKHAGIAPITLIKEPEAAALFTLNFLKNKGLEIGDAIVLCDAGGGTVDLISYEIVRMTPLELKELVPCTGGLAGSLMLNRRFEQWVKDIVGEDAFFPLRKTHGFRLAMKQFDETIKVALGSKANDVYYLNFPMSNIQDDPDQGVKSNTLTMTEEALQEIFDPLLKDISKLVGEQVNQVLLKRIRDAHPKAAAIRAIFLVGGFGESAYLRDSIASTHSDIQVIQPEDAWSAIVRGAVLSQLAQYARVTSNIASKHYGVSSSWVHDPARDAGQQKWLDSWELVWKSTILTWYINIGDGLSRSRKISFPFYRKFSADLRDDELIITDRLLECSATTQPIHPTKGVVTTNCTLIVDLSAVPRHLFRKKTRYTDGATYYELHYNLMVTTQSGPMLFSLEVGGKAYGQVNAEY